LARIEIKNLVKTFDRGKVKAVDNLSITIADGSLVAFLGPSGCGKTTTLRCVAGLEQQDAGEIFFGEKLISSPALKINLPPEKRGLGMVFQSYAIWPHMTVFDNVAYPLRSLRIPRNEIRQRTMAAIEQVGLLGFENRYPTKMSGGQQQRVAFARAVVAKPQALLFDEPLSNLDAQLREKMRFEIVELQKSTKITTIYVTHDQAEAMVISDKIVIMNAGVIEQTGTAREIYGCPKNKFVAGFIGLTNFISGKVLAKGPSRDLWIVAADELGAQFVARATAAVGDAEAATVSIRPEHIELFRERPAGRENVIAGRIVRMTYIGEYSDVLIQAGALELRVHSPSHLSFEPGQAIFFAFHPERCNLLTR